MAYRQAFIELTNGSYFKAVDTAYTVAMGTWWIILLYGLFLFMVYMKTRSEGTVFWGALLGTAFLLARGKLPLEMQPVVYLISAIALGMLLYRAFGRD